MIEVSRFPSIILIDSFSSIVLTQRIFNSSSNLKKTWSRYESQTKWWLKKFLHAILGERFWVLWYVFSSWIKICRPYCVCHERYHFISKGVCSSPHQALGRRIKSVTFHLQTGYWNLEADIFPLHSSCF